MMKHKPLIMGAVTGLALLGALFLFSTKQSPVTSVVATPPAPATFSMAEVSAHNSESSCWSAINSKVYNLTTWINNHPGGPGLILSICGIDGSSAFNAQHSRTRAAQRELATFYIGDLKQ